MISPSLFSLFLAVKRVKGKSIARPLSKHFCLQLFCQRLSFCTVCLNNYLHEVITRWAQSEIFWILGLYIAGKFIPDTLWLQRHSLHFLELYNSIRSFMRLSFITQFKIEFLWPFTGCRKVLGKMPDTQNENNYICHVPYLWNSI